MTNKQIAAALREMALYDKYQSFVFLDDDVFVATIDFWWVEKSGRYDAVVSRMYMLFVAESLS